MKTLVLGLGNPILSDDGVGLHVATALKATIAQPDVCVLKTELGGINLLEQLAGYERAIVIDSIKTQGGKPGNIYQLTPESLIGTRHTNSTHGIDFAATIELGKKLGMAIPKDIIIFAIEAEDVSTFSEDCGLQVKQAIPVCIDRITQILKEYS
jgi:hydrogenase maturation protease